MLSVTLNVLALPLFCFHRCLSYNDFTPYFFLNYLILYSRAYFKTPFCVFSSVQSLSRVQLFVTPWTAARQASLSITNSQSLFKLMSIKLVMPINHLILRHPLLLPSVFPSIRVFSNESAVRIRWPKYWNFSFSTSPSTEYSGLISLSIDWFALLEVKGTLKESSPTPQFKSISSLALSFLYSPTLTSIRDYWKNHSFDWMDRC